MSLITAASLCEKAASLLDASPQEAYQNYLNASQLNPKFAPAHNGLGRCHEYGYGTIIDNLKAFECYREALRWDPKRDYLNFKIGVCYQDGIGVARDMRKALRYLKKATQLDQYSTKAWYRLGLCNEYYDRFNDAFECFSKAAEFNPEQPETWLKLSEYYRNGLATPINPNTEEECLENYYKLTTKQSNKQQTNAELTVSEQATTSAVVSVKKEITNNALVKSKDNILDLASKTDQIEDKLPLMENKSEEENKLVQLNQFLNNEISQKKTLLSTLDRTYLALHKSNSDVTNLSTRCSNLETAIQEKESVIHSQSAQILQQDSQIYSLSNNIQEKDKTIDSLTNELNDLKSQLSWIEYIHKQEHDNDVPNDLIYDSFQTNSIEHSVLNQYCLLQNLPQQAVENSQTSSTSSSQAAKNTKLIFK